MTEALPGRGERTRDLKLWEGGAPGDEPSAGLEQRAEELGTLEIDGVPALAEQFRITDLQHWIDLCA
jgi:hypothetical protein